jgi:predicted nucleotidyltransferase component of viral defense system
MNQTYIDTVRLLLAIAPAVFASDRFAMKGGTALNLFVQEMPRLSVDIDLVLVDHRPDRRAALQAIGQELAAACWRRQRSRVRDTAPTCLPTPTGMTSSSWSATKPPRSRSR